jgi:hypothetical protein
MSILEILGTPEYKKPKCLACAWVDTLGEAELKHLETLVMNYSTAELCRQLRNAGVRVGESTLRKHLVAAH